jgi:hypothetical protein
MKGHPDIAKHPRVFAWYSLLDNFTPDYLAQLRKKRAAITEQKKQPKVEEVVEM